MIVYHGGYCAIEKPEIRIAKSQKRLAKFKHPTHQLAFCAPEALDCLRYLKSYEV